jgi:hypothetical protein
LHLSDRSVGEVLPDGSASQPVSFFSHGGHPFSQYVTFIALIHVNGDFSFSFNMQFLFVICPVVQIGTLRVIESIAGMSWLKKPGYSRQSKQKGCLEQTIQA